MRVSPTAETPVWRSRDSCLLDPPTPWLAQVEPERVPEAEQLPSAVEVVVIGGGVIGVAAAYWLARHGAEVLLLESRRLAWGASGRNAGLVLGDAASLATVQTVLAEEEIDAAYVERGHLALASSEAVLESFRREIAERPPTAARLHLIDHAECEELLGTRIAECYLGGRWMPVAAAVHPARLVYGLARAAARRGASIVSRAPVQRLRRAATGHSWELRTTRGRIRARRVVLACNVGSVHLWSPLARVLSPSRGQVLATRPLPQVFRPGMAVDYGTVYWRQTADGAVILGGYRTLDPVAEHSVYEVPNPRIQAALEGFLPEAFPDLPPVAVAARWAGIMDATPDGRPIVGAWPDDSGLWVAVGFGGHGLPPALATGRALARSLIEGGSTAELDRLGPARFREVLAC